MRMDRPVEFRIETAERALALLQHGWPTKTGSLVGDDLRFPLRQFIGRLPGSENRVTQSEIDGVAEAPALDIDSGEN